MKNKAKIVIIGAGSAGLSAFSVIKKQTQDVLVVQDGPQGTTCARVGCMPSKVFLQAANDFYRRFSLAQEGISGADSLTIDHSKTMEHVRALRDRFVRGVMGTVEEIGDRMILGRAKFLSPNEIQVGDQVIEAEKIILATGSTPVVPAPWREFGDQVMTTDDFFEQKTLPPRIGVVGTGVIGLELGQGLHRLGLDVKIFGRSRRVAGLSDPVVNDAMIESLEKELPLHFAKDLKVEKTATGSLKFSWSEGEWEGDQVLAAMGRAPNLKGIGLEEIGVPFDEKGIPRFDRETMQIEGMPIFIGGDVNSELTLLHEAADEGRIAAYNALSSQVSKFKRRVPLAVCFSDPNVAVIGKGFKELSEDEIEIGEVSFKGQGRSIVMLKEKGHLRVYGEKKTGRLLGAELAAPSGEHLAHLLSWAIQCNLTVAETLRLPFYHPVVEEGLRTALRELSRKVAGDAEVPLEIERK